MNDASDFAERMTELTHEVGELLASACKGSPHPPELVMESGLKIILGQIRTAARIHLGLPVTIPDTEG